GGIAMINANVAGAGSLSVSGTLIFGKSVGSGQEVDVVGGTVQVSQPTKFLGSAQLLTGGTGHVSEIDLMGLANADSYTYQNDLLSIFSGSSVIDKLHLHDSTPNGFAVEKTAGSVN